MKNDYYIVEFRFPYRSEAKTPEAAAEEAIRLFKDQYGFAPPKWNARVFEFSSKKDTVGAQKEYFFSPSGMTMKEISQNHEKTNP